MNPGSVKLLDCLLLKANMPHITNNLYEKDFYAWSHQQADLLRIGSVDNADWLHIAEEIDNMGKREKRELASRLEVLLLHLLKWQYQPARRGTSWTRSIREQRIKIADHLEDNPSLKAILPGILDHAYELAVIAAVDETGLLESQFPETCPYSSDEMQNRNFWPEMAP